MKRFILACSMLGLLAPAAHAAEFKRALPDKSSIAFSYKQMGVPMEGRFKAFSSQLSLDPDKPEAGKAVIEVDLLSIDTGSKDNDAEVAGKPWFNTASFPKARFESTGVKALGGNRYEVAGKLTIKGATRDVVIPTTFARQGDLGLLDGSFTLKRGDFAIGEGEWSATDIVANDIQVKFHITAAAGQ